MAKEESSIAIVEMSETVPGATNSDEDELNRLKTRISSLEEENDLLAIAATREPKLIANVKRLTERINELEVENKTLKDANQELLRGRGGEAASADDTASQTPIEAKEDPLAPFVVPGDRETASRRATNVLRGCHGGINVLCARVCPGEVDIVASGGADKSLLVSRLTTRAATGSDGVMDGSLGETGGAVEIDRLRFAAPVLSMDFCPSESAVLSSCASSSCTGALSGLLLAGCMDGGSHLVAVGPGVGSGDDEDQEEVDEQRQQQQPATTIGVKLVASLKDHSKYVACRWAPDGSAFVTASHDKVVTLYVHGRNGSGEGSGGGVGGTGFEQATRLYLPEAIEAVEFVRASGGGLELVISARGHAHLTYVNLETMQQRKVSLNEKDWDTHVSFTVMSLAASPDGKYLLGATDKSRNILWRAGSNARVRTLMGQSTDEYFQPRVAWAPSGMFSYCNSSGDNDVHMHCLASGRVVDRLKGHSSVVRDLYHDLSKPVLVTASYDKTVRVWGQA